MLQPPDHEHVWVRSDVVIDINPPLHTKLCRKCGFGTHDNGKTICMTKHYIDIVLDDDENDA